MNIIFLSKNVVFKTLKFSSSNAIWYVQFKSSNTEQSISVSIWYYTLEVKKKIKKVKKVLL